MAFYGAQTFLLDSSTVNQAAAVYLSKVSVYFSSVPSATGNRSGIAYPGATMFVAPTDAGVPVIGTLSALPMARVEYNDVRASGDASVPTDFVFASLPILTSGKTYALVIKFDGDEDFVAWKSVTGDVLLGTANTVSTGPVGKYVGAWFDYVSAPTTANANPTSSSAVSSAISSGVPTVVTAADGTSWRVKSSVDLKFTVSVARFAHAGSANLETLVSNTLIPPSAVITPSSAGVSVDANTGVWTFVVPTTRYEFIQYDPRRSKIDDFCLAERCWQHLPFYPSNKSPYTVSVSNGSSVVTTSSNVDFTTFFGQGPDPSYVAVASGNTWLIRQVSSVTNSTSMIVERPLTVTNTAAYFYRPPVGIVDSIISTKVDAADADLLVLTESNANSILRFSNSVVESVSVIAGGTGYSNSDVLTVSGYQQVSGKVVGGSNATAYLSTNSTGGITTVYMASPGAGFSNASAIAFSVANSTGGATTGSGASFSASVGMTVASEVSFNPGANGYCSNCQVVNPGVTEVLLSSTLNNPMGTFLSAEMVLSYYRVADSSVVGGYRYHVDSTTDDDDVFFIKPGVPEWPTLKKSRVFPSWSNEIVITNEANGATQGFTGSTGTTNSAITIVTAASNNDFTMVTPGTLATSLSHYDINDVYSGEETDRGSAAARGITNRVTLANGSYAEDIRVWIDAWKPSGTDVKVYARVQNDADSESFDDKDWTLLELIDGSGTSSLTDQSDTIEFTYGFPLYPNTAFTLDGTLTVANGSAVVTGTGTSFATQLANGDVIRIYNPLFANVDHVVMMVETVTNATSITLTQALANSGITGSGMKADKTAFPHQAFNNIENENVVKYYSQSGGFFNEFNVFQVKIILLSPDYMTVPKLDDVRISALSS